MHTNNKIVPFVHLADLDFTLVIFVFFLECGKGLFRRVATGQEMVREKFLKVGKVRENCFFLEGKSGKNE